MRIAATTRPSSDQTPYAIIGYATAALAIGAFGLFAARAPLDSAAIATGRVATESATKPIQHLEGGIVSEILVKDTESVKAGQVLFRLESAQSAATAELLRAQIDSALAQESRLLAERDMASTLRLPAELEQRMLRAGTASVVADQKRQLEESRQVLESQKRIYSARVEQANASRSGQLAQKMATERQVASTRQEIQAVSPLAAKGLYPKNRLLALERQQASLEGQKGGLEGDIARSEEMISEAKSQLQQTEQNYSEKATVALAEVRVRLAELQARLSAASDVMSRMEIRAPQDGSVQGIRVRTAGAVLKPGDTIADLVPAGERLVLTVKISPLDIDSVAKGQKAEIRFPGLSSRSLPVVLGRVERVATDASVDDTTREAYYQGRVAIDASTIEPEVLKRLQPGMPADVIISTGERTVLQYFVGPLMDVVSKSMRER